MAVVRYIKVNHQTSGAMYGIIKYCLRDEKVYDEITGRRMVSGINCNGENAYAEFMTTKEVYKKTNGMFFYQYMQAFSPEENITPEQAHNLAREFAEQAWPEHEILIATHSDRDHVHSHFVINSVSFSNGYKLRQDRHTLERLRMLSDKICIKHGYTIIENPRKSHGYVSAREYRVAKNGKSWKVRLMNAIDKAMQYSGSRQEFELEMKKLGYEMNWTDERKNITFICPGGNKCRDKKLYDEKYLKRSIEDELKIREKSIREIQGSESGYNGRDTGGAVPLDSVRNPGETVGALDETTRAGGNISADTVRENTRESDHRGFRGFAESGSGMYEEIRNGDSGEEFTGPEGYEGDYQTGWESERGIYFEYVMGGKTKDQRTSGPEGRVRKENDENNFQDGTNLGDTLAGGLHSLASFAESVENDNDDEEERKKKKQARDAGAALGMGLAATAEIVSALVTNDRIPEELIEEQEEIEEEIEEDIDNDFYFGM